MGWAERANPNSIYNRQRTMEFGIPEKKSKRGVGMTEEIVATSKRAGRIGLDVIIAQVVVSCTGNVAWLGLAPLLAAVGKFLRAVFKLNFIPF